MPEIKKNTVLTLEVEDLAFGGMGVAKPDGFVVFVEGAVPGDRVKARIFKKSKNHATARLEEIESPSPDRIIPECPIFDVCGGCTWQQLRYEDQLKWKSRHVADTLSRLGGLDPLPEIRPIIASPEVWNYRNKMEYSFGADDTGKVILGFHRPGRFDSIFEVPACLIHPKPFDELLAAITEWAREESLDAYDPRRHEGLLRHAVMRHSKTTGGVVLTLITSSDKLKDPEALTARLRERCSSLQGLIWGVNPGLADVATLAEEKFRWGDPVLVEELNGLSYRISPAAFFQTNSRGAELLYRHVVDLAELHSHDLVLDAYCGAGTIATHCASRVRHVAGIEIVRDAIWDARVNAKNNGIRNTTFLVGTIAIMLPLAVSSIGKFSRVIIDPPRGGMDKKSLARLIDVGAQVFVYVSCNPSTFARDVVTLGAAGYQLEVVQPVDMFPHTPHIELVARFRKATP